MLKIGDFSQLGQVSVRTLRHYDDLDLLKPAHIDRFTDYRYYTMDQLPRLNRILALKDLGFSLEQIARLLDTDLPAAELRGMLKMKQSEIEEQLRDGQARLMRVEARLRQIEHEGQLANYAVVLKEVAPQWIASARVRVPSVDAMARYRCGLFEDLYRWLARQRLQPVAPELVVYYGAEYVEENIDTEVAVIVDPASLKSARPVADDDERMSLRELPGVSVMASVIHHGRFHDVCDAIVALYTWLGLNGYTPAGSYRELHLFGRENGWENFDAVTIEMQTPAEKA